MPAVSASASFARVVSNLAADTHACATHRLPSRVFAANEKASLPCGRFLARHDGMGPAKHDLQPSFFKMAATAIATVS
jgi:hypothetical protein